MSDIQVISQTQVIDVGTITQSISVNPLTQAAIVVSSPTSAISIVNAGPVGPAGAGTGYNFSQLSDLSTWTINHNLGYKPSVQTFTVGGLEVLGEVQHISSNQVTVTFNTAISGTARLN
jgi:hypothetical protein